MLGKIRIETIVLEEIFIGLIRLQRYVKDNMQLQNNK